jgi:hypothetical protein
MSMLDCMELILPSWLLRPEFPARNMSLDVIMHTVYTQFKTSQVVVTQISNNKRLFDTYQAQSVTYRSVAKAAVMQVMQCMTKNFPKNV